MSEALASEVGSYKQTDPRTEQEKFDRAMNIVIEVSERAKDGNKTCIEILRKFGALR